MQSGDRALIQIVDAALAEAARKSGAWLVCRPGCNQCCIGPFAISQLDAWRLGRGLAELQAQDPKRAGRVRERARDYVTRQAAAFPGDPVTGVLDEGGEAEERFSEFADDEPCPALDPDTGLCDLYDARPLTCRMFGPPLRSGSDDLGVCELCFDGASDEEIAACAVEMDSADLESALLGELEKTTGARGETIVAYALAESWRTTTKSDS
jgi:Fe-S-cluster containining protein